MTLVRSILVSIVAVGLVVTLSQASLARGESHGGHESHGKAGHEGHHEEHHEGHHEEHHEEHHDAHHEEGHREEHHEDAHHEEHPDAHHEEGHHEEHHDAHHEEHPDEHHDAHRDEHHDEHHDAHHDEHHDAHHDAHHDDHHDEHHDEHHEIDHKDWYKHEWWHHQTTWHHQSWQHWWHCPTTTEINHWSAGWGLSAPVYYDYGSGGNVVYRNNGVYVNGALVGTADAYANSAIALAQASPTTDVANVSPATDTTNVSDTADAADAMNDPSEQWMPLGTFAVLTQEGDTQPSQTLQLALDKNGNISGVLFDLAKDTSTPIRGSLDRATQRVAFDLGADSGLVAETGLYNLTKDEVTLLVHKGTEKPETYTLVRFDTPPADAEKEGIAQASQ